MAERSSLWNTKPENRYLPSLLEWLSIRALTQPKHWTEPQRHMMKRAAWVHRIRSAVAVVWICVLVAAGAGLKRQTEERRNQAEVQKLESILDQRLEPDWRDAPLDAGWTQPTIDVRVRIESAHGFIADRFAFCQDMPLPQFLEVAESLRPSGYRPTRIRPLLTILHLKAEKTADTPNDGAAPALQVSAIWTRDPKRWHNLNGTLPSLRPPGWNHLPPMPPCGEPMWILNRSCCPAFRWIG